MKDKLLNALIYILLIAIIGLAAYIFIFNNKVVITNIKLNKSSIRLEIGESEQLIVTVLPPEVKDKSVIWESENNAIATVDSNGVVTGKGVGTTAAIVKSSDGKAQNKCYVIVKSKVTPTPEPTPTPTPEPTPTPIPEYEITYYGVDKTSKVVKQEGEKLGMLPTQTKTYYLFLGWYTDKTGGTKVDENTIVTSNMNLYPHWQEDFSGYIVTRDAPLPTGFTPTSYNYDSNTLKYKVYNDSTGYYFALVWVRDAAKQLHSALPMKNDGNTSFHKVKVDANVNNEITKYGYNTKGIIAVNGSFSWSSDPGIRVVINRGEIVRSLNKDNGPKYSSLGIRSNGELKGYDTGANLESEMVKDGVLNNWAIVGYTTTNWTGYISGQNGGAARTQICQIDKNNFILLNIINSKGTSYPKGWKIMHDYFPNCVFAANLDGGGSTRMYYKTNTMSTMAKIYESYDTNRANVDALYFVEQ